MTEVYTDLNYILWRNYRKNKPGVSSLGDSYTDSKMTEDGWTAVWQSEQETDRAGDHLYRILISMSYLLPQYEICTWRRREMPPLASGIDFILWSWIFTIFCFWLYTCIWLKMFYLQHTNCSSAHCIIIFSCAPNLCNINKSLFSGLSISMHLFHVVFFPMVLIEWAFCKVPM